MYDVIINSKLGYTDVYLESSHGNQSSDFQSGEYYRFDGSDNASVIEATTSTELSGLAYLSNRTVLRLDGTDAGNLSGSKYVKLTVAERPIPDGWYGIKSVELRMTIDFDTMTRITLADSAGDITGLISYTSLIVNDEPPEGNELANRRIVSATFDGTNTIVEIQGNYSYNITNDHYATLEAIVLPAGWNYIEAVDSTGEGGTAVTFVESSGDLTSQMLYANLIIYNDVNEGNIVFEELISDYAFDGTNTIAELSSDVASSVKTYMYAYVSVMGIPGRWYAVEETGISGSDGYVKLKAGHGNVSASISAEYYTVNFGQFPDSQDVQYQGALVSSTFDGTNTIITIANSEIASATNIPYVGFQQTEAPPEVYNIENVEFNEVEDRTQVTLSPEGGDLTSTFEVGTLVQTYWDNMGSEITGWMSAVDGSSFNGEATVLSFVGDQTGEIHDGTYIGIA